MAQSATNVLAAIKAETTFNVQPATVTGADRIRFIDSPGLKLSRANIESTERRSDQTQHIGRLGSKTVAGSYSAEVNPGGEFDILMAASVRATLGSLAEVTAISPGGSGVGTQVALATPPAAAVNTSYTIEQYDIDIDQSEIFTGCRLTSTAITFQPGQMATMAWSFMGADRQVLATGASPFYTSPTLTTSTPLIADDATITYAGSTVATITGMSLNIEVDAAGQPVIGSFVTPDITTNMLKVSGELSAIREDLDALTDFDSETEFEIKVVLKSTGSGPHYIFAFVMPRVKITDIDAAFSGGDASKVETRQFSAYAQAGASDVINLYTSTETPTFVA